MFSNFLFLIFADAELNINKRAEDELKNLSMDRSGDAGYVNIILPAVFGRAALVTAGPSLKQITNRVRQSPKYATIRGLLFSKFLRASKGSYILFRSILQANW